MSTMLSAFGSSGYRINGRGAGTTELSLSDTVLMRHAKGRQEIEYDQREQHNYRYQDDGDQDRVTDRAAAPS